MCRMKVYFSKGKVKPHLAVCNVIISCCCEIPPPTLSPQPLWMQSSHCCYPRANWRLCWALTATGVARRSLSTLIYLQRTPARPERSHRLYISPEHAPRHHHFKQCFGIAAVLWIRSVQLLKCFSAGFAAVYPKHMQLWSRPWSILATHSAEHAEKKNMFACAVLKTFFCAQTSCEC